MQIDILDVGKTMYGDCVLIRRGDRSILVDAAHPGDATLILEQLQQLFDHAPPYEVDLLVLTHCHSDHIGCLPTLVANGDLSAKTALMADENMGFGRNGDGTSPVDAMNLTRFQQALVAALQEEDYSDLPQAELEQFLLEDVTLEDRYNELLQQLAEAGAKVVRFQGVPATEVQQVETTFVDFGLQILGPTNSHLLTCARAIADGTDAIADVVSESNTDAISNPFQLADVYRGLLRHLSDSEGFADRKGIGAAKNDQSIVLRVQADGWSALLAGDMQFAVSEVTGLDDEMTVLRKAVVDAGPYDFIKLTHHTSYNGVDDSVLDDWGHTELFAHSGGLNDANHPDPGALIVLKNRRNSLTFARTDRNGLISVTKNGTVKMTPSKGKLNTFAANHPRQDVAEPIEVSSELEATHPVASAAIVPKSSLPISVTSGVPRNPPVTDGMVEVITHIPPGVGKVMLTIQVEQNLAKRDSDPSVTVPSNRLALSNGTRRAPRSVNVPKVRLGGGRHLPNLLFVTCVPTLTENIGGDSAAGVMDALTSTRSVQVVDLPTSIKTAEEAVEHVRPRLLAGKFEGVVLLGGLDVVPAYVLNVVDDDLRQRANAVAMRSHMLPDDDNYIVWSDELYGDTDGDYLAELPVSRIPDGRLADVVLNAIQAPKYEPGTRFGIRNLAREFAIDIFPAIPGQGGELHVSETFGPDNIADGSPIGAVYYMLHGSDRDGTRFWGERKGGGDTLKRLPFQMFPQKHLAVSCSQAAAGAR